MASEGKFRFFRSVKVEMHPENEPYSAEIAREFFLMGSAIIVDHIAEERYIAALE